MSVKVKPSEQQDFKPFEIEMVEITWKKRCELNDMMIESTNGGNNPAFSFWGDLVLKFTKLSEEDLNRFSTDEIVAISHTIFEVANAKKK